MRWLPKKVNFKGSSNIQNIHFWTQSIEFQWLFKRCVEIANVMTSFVITTFISTYTAKRFMTHFYSNFTTIFVDILFCALRSHAISNKIYFRHLFGLHMTIGDHILKWFFNYINLPIYFTTSPDALRRYLPSIFLIPSGQFWLFTGNANL